MLENALDTGDVFESQIDVELLGVKIVFRHLPEYPFNTELAERVVEGDEEYVTVDPARVKTGRMNGDGFAGVMAEDHPAETHISPVSADRDAAFRVVRGAGKLSDSFAVSRFVEDDPIQFLPGSPFS